MTNPRAYDATGSVATRWQACEDARCFSRTFAPKGEALAVTEYLFQPDGAAPPARFAPYAAQWLWDSPLPIVLSYVHVGEEEVPWTMTAESARLCTHLGGRAQAGVYALRNMGTGTLVGFLQGDRLGAFREGSKAYEDAVRQALAGYDDSYLFTTRRPGGAVDLWDGRGDRLGGMSRVNDGHGIGARANLGAAMDMPKGDFTEDGVLRAVCKVRRVDALLPRDGWQRRELFFNYSAEYWRRYSGALGACDAAGEERRSTRAT